MPTYIVSHLKDIVSRAAEVRVQAGTQKRAKLEQLKSVRKKPHQTWHDDHSVSLKHSFGNNMINTSMDDR